MSNKEICNKLYDRVCKFMTDNKVSCEEAIYQCDWVIENAYSFIGDLYNIVESNPPIEEEN